MVIVGNAVLAFGIISVFGAAVHNNHRANAASPPVATVETAAAFDGFTSSARELPRGYRTNPATSPLAGFTPLSFPRPVRSCARTLVAPRSQRRYAPRPQMSTGKNEELSLQPCCRLLLLVRGLRSAESAAPRRRAGIVAVQHSRGGAMDARDRPPPAPSRRNCMSSSLALPVGDQAAGARDHGHEGREVVELQRILDHQVDMARGQQAVGVAVAAPAEELHLLGQRLVRFSQAPGNMIGAVEYM